MPVSLASLSPEDREDLERRLKVFNLDVSAMQESLSVPPAARITLGFGPKVQSARPAVVVRSTSFSEVKRMVGLDDRIARFAGRKVALPRPVHLGRVAVPGIGSVLRDAKGASRSAFSAAPGASADDAQAQFDSIGEAELRSMDSESITNVRLAARAFVRGNSELVASYLPVIQKVVGEVVIPVFPIMSITVPRGSVLEFGPGVNVLLAYELHIEDGGTVRSHGHLTVSCTRVHKPGKTFKPTLTTLTGGFKPVFSE